MGSLSNTNAFSGIVKNADSGGSGFPVNITDPQEGQILTFDSENEQWVNSNSRIKVVTVTWVEREATQDDVDNYGYYYDVANDDVKSIEIGESYLVNEIPIKYNEIADSDYIVIMKGINNIGCSIASGYKLSGGLYNLYQNYDEEAVKGSYYSLNQNVNLRKFALFTPPTP